MQRIFLLFIVSLLFQAAKSQVKALAEDGRQVLLYDDGTWKYFQDSAKSNGGAKDSIEINTGKFSKSSDQTFFVKSTRFNVGIYINPDAWTYSFHKDNEVNPEYRFTMKSGDAGALCMTEKNPFDLSTMEDIVLTNARKASLDARIIKREYRTVNKAKVLCLEMKATIKGIKFVYLGYYYSDENGTIQLLTYSTEKFFGEERKSLEDFLNGFFVPGKK